MNAHTLTIASLATVATLTGAALAVASATSPTLTTDAQRLPVLAAAVLVMAAACLFWAAASHAEADYPRSPRLRMPRRVRRALARGRRARRAQLRRVRSALR